MNLHEENNKPDKENNPFSLPGDYFNSFSKKMTQKIELLDELKEFKILYSLDKKLPFVTPHNYFELRNELAQYPVLLSLKSKKVFEIPDQYFENSAIRISNKIEIADELNTYPLIASFDKQHMFTIPVSYFENSSQEIKEKIYDSNSGNESAIGKVLHIVFSKKTVYAIAAMLVISLGLYFYNSNTDAALIDCNTLACLDKNEIIKANQLNNFDDDALIEIVNTDELSKNLTHTLQQENKNTGENDGTEDFVLENVDINDITDEI